MKNSVYEDLTVPLYKVQRRWIRVPITIILSIVLLPMVIIAGIIVGVYELGEEWWVEFVSPCLIGNIKE